MINPNPVARRVRRALVPLLGSTALVAMMFAAPTATADEHWEVVASGLDNPRHLSVGPGGDLFVAEAGRGGGGQCFDGPEGSACFGFSGAITRVSLAGGQERVVEGLPSFGGEGTGEGAIGPADVMTEGSKRLIISVGLGAPPDLRDGIPGAEDMGTLRAATVGSDDTTLIADLAGHEADENPIHDPDSNPVGFTRDGSGWVVADAGGNTLVGVSKRGATETVAVLEDQAASTPFPGFLSQAVPTSVVKGPDGAWYVSLLTGFPFEKGLAKIYKIDRQGAMSVYATGLTNVTDLAFGPGNVLYAVQLSTEGLLTGPIGSVVAIPKGGGDSHSVIAENLFAPYGIAIRGTTAYVTTGAVLAGAGQVIAIPLR